MKSYLKTQEAVQRTNYIRLEIQKTCKIKDRKKRKDLYTFYKQSIEEVIKQGISCLDGKISFKQALEISQIVDNYKGLLLALEIKGLLD